jgi:3-deoxy-D-manno-octulosonic-acid transferase
VAGTREQQDNTLVRGAEWLPEAAGMLLYSLALALVFVLGAPYWLVRMATSGRYRAGLAGRLGRVPAPLRAAVTSKQVVWVHAVSVGEVLAATRLVRELAERLGESWIIVVSTTTATGQALAGERFASAVITGARVFWYPLDFGFAVRAYLRALKPRLLVLMESELWPRMLVECRRGAVPVAVVNARVSDRSFARGMKVRILWGWLLRKVTRFLAQSEQDASRLIAMGVPAEAVEVTGNLKYDVRAAPENAMVQRLGRLRGASRVIVAGSTLEGEEQMLLDAWPEVLRAAPEMLLVLAPRHPERFAPVHALLQASGYPVLLCSQLAQFQARVTGGTILLLDTIGDLASVYSVAQAAFIGGSLVPRGGHNPLEAAQFGVPILMGQSYENFRAIVEGMRQARAIRITTPERLAQDLMDCVQDGQELGSSARRFFLAQAGATARTVDALLALLSAGEAR